MATKVTLDDIRAAAGRLSGKAQETPLLSSAALDARFGARVLFKAECLQRTGSFKFRGAYNCISLIPEEVRARGVVACSSGNHAQGVAEAARLFGIPATIVMPDDAPALKRARTERSGARVVPYDRVREDREAIARAIGEETGATFIHPFEDPRVIAGQGTVGLEIVAQAAALGVVPDAVLIPASGGGLLAGSGLALKAALPDVAIYAVEPAGFDDHRRSLASGAREHNEKLGGSISDALLAAAPGENTFAINRDQVAGGLAVSDDDALSAVGVAAEELKVVTEPGGAVGLGALLSGEAAFAGKTVVVVLSGGNIEPDMLARAIGKDG
ncbi:MAG: pyridoxal-5'-phosphate-dependent protein [Hyphomicrobiales bacterium]|nr:MAG: pyridoxal-5'-phosphate-dependent protein [Hyphomicrobiales bacterium]